MTATIIRTATSDDVPAMHRLLGELAATIGESDAYRGGVGALQKFGFGDHRVFRAALAEHDGSCEGLCIYFPEFSSWRGRSGVYVQDLFVASSLRGSGVGRRLLAEAMVDSVHAWQAGYMRLAVHVSNGPAVDFYSGLGFVTEHDNRAMVLDGEAALSLLEPGNRPGPAA